MRVITEIELRDRFKKAEFTSFKLSPDCRLTPSAAQFLSERKISLVTAEESQAGKVDQKSKTPTVGSQNNKLINSGLVSRDEKAEGVKPEYMTHLRGNKLVPKNHSRIKFRGKLDTFEALLIDLIIDVETWGQKELGRDLQAILEYARQIMSAEVREEKISLPKFHGWSPQEIRERSHYPDKYFGVNHLLPNPGQGKLMSKLNLLRTQVRELELYAIDAFYDENDVQREDIIQGLNRLSSLIYIMMVQLVSGYYRVGC